MGFWKVLAVCGLACMTMLWFEWLTPYTVTGQDTVAGARFERVDAAWRTNADLEHRGGSAALQVSPRDGQPPFLTERILLDGSHHDYRAVFVVRPWRGEIGTEFWHTVAPVVRVDSPYQVVSRRAGPLVMGAPPFSGWQKLEMILRLAPNVSGVTLGLAARDEGTGFAVRRISLVPVSPRTWFSYGSIALMAGWAACGLWLARGLASHLSRPRMVAMAILVALVIFIAAAAPIAVNDVFLQTVRVTYEGLLSLLPDGVARSLPSGADSILHAGTFFMLGCLLRYGLPGLAVGSLVTQLVLLAIATEVLQYFAEGRSPEWSDFIMDLVGIGAVVLSHLLMRAGTLLRRV